MVLMFADEYLFIKKYNVIIKKLLVLKLLRFTDRLLSGFITHYFIVIIIIGYHIEFMLFYITKLLLFVLVILKMLWLKKYNLRVEFSALGLKFNSNYYTYNCLP